MVITNLAICTELWKLLNKVFFEGAEVNWVGFKGRVYQVIHDNSIRMKDYTFNIMEDLRIWNYFKVKHRVSKTSKFIEISWSSPEQGDLMICCDGASCSNPCQASAGIYFRDASSSVVGALCVGLGWKTNYIAEVSAVIYGLMLTRRWNMKKICVRSDSMRCLQALKQGEFPWELFQKWKVAYAFYENVRYVHNYREVKFYSR
ncbi:uncharacterized protein LOC113324292 [Papaver somniferum]|uniref:uncharacterized protein LOC113324292 n=1 Tax=Papaver somniferum TaxID=3469 RepID=UPI000E704A66|nr:uncharacterized protein LOC113324292 [Papaver somniferum]